MSKHLYPLNTAQLFEANGKLNGVNKIYDEIDPDPFARNRYLRLQKEGYLKPADAAAIARMCLRAQANPIVVLLGPELAKDWIVTPAEDNDA